MCWMKPWLLIACGLHSVVGTQLPMESVAIKPQGGFAKQMQTDQKHGHGRAMRMERRSGTLDVPAAYPSMLLQMADMPYVFASDMEGDVNFDISSQGVMATTTTPDLAAEMQNLSDMANALNETLNETIQNLSNVTNGTHENLPAYKLVDGWKDESGELIKWRGGDVIALIWYLIVILYGVFNVLSFSEFELFGAGPAIRGALLAVFPARTPHEFTAEEEAAQMVHREEKSPDNTTYDIPALWFMRHPAFRLYLATFTIFDNFWIFQEDPVPDSMRHADLPGIGNVMTFVFTRWPDDGGLVVLKLVNILFASILGVVFGRQVVHHKFLRNFCGLSAFQGCKGTWMVMLFTWAFFCFNWSWMIYNPILSAAADQDTYNKCFTRSELVMSSKSFCDMAAMGTWFGDAITWVMVTDQMLQDWSQYGWWAPGLRNFWTKHRIPLSLGYLFVGTLILILIWHVIDTGPTYDTGGGKHFSTDEFSRAMIAGCIWWNDMMIVMMDWEFPTFDSGLSIKAPFVNSESWNLAPPESLTRQLSEEFRDFFRLQVTGKWMQYGVLFIVMFLDFNMLKNQVLYEPSLYAQYVENSGRIWTIQDYHDANLRMPNYLESGNSTFLTVWIMSSGRIVELWAPKMSEISECSRGILTLGPIGCEVSLGSCQELWDSCCFTR
eukprot:gnl/MRDRNA2_/MRDRNA2_77050_c0_seq1.p1 gnl/MRDRNA2_/MRDRNA2_77050_c0~~gnl/MRDRNA2_/MRDRNA2_77050_c0_seq1.p1  ORF type:complete len:665 (-),score=72.50 gnl/MRDRNA2_/MRDRNA2_77050_c0_seq1:343-2337(-)